MPAPDWLRQAIEAHGGRAAREGWGRAEWRAIPGIDTEYRARQCTIAVRVGVDNWTRRVTSAPATATTLDVSETDGDDGKSGHWYETTEIGDYRFWLRGRARPIILSKDDVRELVASYVADGDGVTQQALARQFGLTRRAISACLKALGVYKDSPPLLPEEIEAGDEDELAEEWAASKAARVERRAHRKAWSEVERDALRWRDLERSTLQYVAGAVRSAVEGHPPPSPPPVAVTARRALLVVPTDVHIGSYGWEGFAPGAVDTGETERRIWAAVARLLGLVPSGAPEVIYLTIGGDLFHVDNAGGSTTRGTPQDLACTPEEMIVTVTRIMYALIRSLRDTAPLRLVLHGGNHDSMMALALYAGLLEAFRDDPRVEPAGDPDHPWGPYQAVQYGESLIGFTHGDGRHKVGDLGPLMAQRWPAMWGATRHRYWFTGHRHHLAVEESRGVEVHTVPSLSGTDRYHARHWPHPTRPRLGGYLFDPAMGLVASLWGDIVGGSD